MGRVKCTVERANTRTDVPECNFFLDISQYSGPIFRGTVARVDNGGKSGCLVERKQGEDQTFQVSMPSLKER